nr:hypothetical protein [Tanacetum cinerariifolium]
MSSKNDVNPPAPNPSHNSSFSLLSVLGRERLTGLKYMDWMRNLRFTLRYENKEYVLDEQIPTINDDSTQEEIKAHQKHYDDAYKVSCIMTYSMSPELQKTFKNTWAYEINQQLKEMFQEKASKEHLDVVKSLMSCKPKPGASICAFILEMKGYFDRKPPSTSVALVLTVGHNAKKRKTSHSNWKGKAAQGKYDYGSKRKAKYEIAPTSDPKEVGLKESRRLKHGELNLVMGNRKITHKEAIKSEIQSMYDNQVWNLVDTTLGLNTMGCKWIFKKKTDMDGKVYTYKPRKLTKDVFMAQPEGFENAKLDVFFSLSMVSRHQHNSGKGYWTLVKNILKYLTNTKDKFLVYGGEEELKKSLRQDTMVDSTCEFEYIVVCEASKEAIWMNNFIRDHGVVPTKQDLIEIFSDNESAVALTKEPKDHRKSKHIERKYHFVQSKVEEGHVIVKQIRSEDDPVDLFTKALAKSRHVEHARSIGLKDKIKFYLLV